MLALRPPNSRVGGILPLVLKRHASHHPDDIIELLDVARQDVLPEVEQGNADLGMGLFLRRSVA